MAAMLCQSAGWWQLEALLGSLSQQAAAGARPELLKLMQVCWGQALVSLAPTALSSPHAPRPAPPRARRCTAW
jgi:hypothetical protein